MKYKAILLITIIILSLFCTVNVHANDTWIDSNFTYRKKIVINSSQVEGSLTNFVFPLNITDSDLKDNAKSNGYDICFYDNDNTTQLKHEIEYYNDTDGRLLAWINLTNVNSSSDKVIYMYYGNSTSDNLENIQDTWDDNYLFVSHMNGTTPSIGSEMTKLGNPVECNSGILSYCYEFDGSDNDDGFNTDGNVYAFDEDTDVTLFAVHEPDLSGFGMVVGHGHSSNGYMEDQLRSYNNKPSMSVQKSGTGSENAIDTVNTPLNWIVQTGTYDNSDNGLSIYVDGDLRGTNTLTMNGATAISDYGIGINPRNDRWEYDGKISEVRISNIVRSNNHIVTTANSILNATDNGFFDVGIQETEGEICECTISNMSPVNGTMNINYDTENLSAVVNSSCGIIDYVNITLYDNTMTIVNYTNHTTGLTNGTYTHVLSNDNLTDGTLYYWDVKTECNNTIETTDVYEFTTYISGGGCDCSTIRTIIRQEINNYNAIKEGDNIEINIAIQSLIIIMGLVLLGFTTFKKDAVICALLGFSATIVFMIPVIENIQFSTINLVYVALAVCSIGITLYKIFLGITETDEIKSPFA